MGISSSRIGRAAALPSPCHRRRVSIRLEGVPLKQQRFSRSHPCPICDGGDDMRRGKQIRCSGFLSSDGAYAHCTRDEFAGALSPGKGAPPAFAHRLVGRCKCGSAHGASADVAAEVVRTIRHAIIDPATGKTVAVHVRAELSDGSKRIWWDGGLRGRPAASLPLYLAHALTDEPEVYVVEGEKAADALASIGVPAVGTVCGASSTPDDAALASLAGRRVVLWPDADEPGASHMARIAGALARIGNAPAAGVSWGCPDSGDDAADFACGGGTAEEARALARPVAELPDELATLRGSAIEAQAVEWLLPGYLPSGFLTILSGRAGLGKSTILYDWSAQISRIGKSVLILTAEDHARAVVRPRLEAARADLDLVRVSMVHPTLPKEEKKLRSVIVRYKPALVVIDPFVAFLGDDTDAHKDHSIRRALAPLSAMAEATGIALLLVVHRRKGADPDPLSTVGGSGGITAAARQVLMAVDDPLFISADGNSGPMPRILAVIKSNLGLIPDAMLYHVETAYVPHPRGGNLPIQTSKIVWDGTRHVDPSSLTAPVNPDQSVALRAAVETLSQICPPGTELDADEGTRQMKAQGHGKNSTWRARGVLGVRSEKLSDGSWRWIR